MNCMPVRYLEALLKHISARTYAVVEVPFEGDGDLFRYWPSRCALPAPQGLLCATSIRLRIERSVKHDDAWKAQLKADVGRIEAFLARSAACSTRGVTGALPVFRYLSVGPFRAQPCSPAAVARCQRVR